MGTGQVASAEGELLACQPYGGATTHIPDYGLGQGPNVVFGLAEQFGLIPGSKVRIFFILHSSVAEPEPPLVGFRLAL